MNFDFIIGWGSPNVDGARKLYEELEKRGYAVGFIVINDDLANKLKELNLLVYNFLSMALSIHISKSELHKYVNQYENRYGMFSMKDFCFPEACYRGMKEEQLIAESVKYFITVETFLQKHKVGCFSFGSIGGQFIQRVTYTVCKKSGIPVMYSNPFPPHFKGKMMIYTDEMNCLEDFTLIPFEKMSEEDRIFIDNFIFSVKEKKQIQTYSVKPVISSASIYSRIVEKVKNGLTYILTRNAAAMKNSMRCRFQNHFIHPSRRFFSKIYYSKFDHNPQYIFFPLHQQNDSQITTRNPQFYHQEWLVQVIAQSLPQGYKLYVKSHPGREHLPLRVIRFISKIPNVVLLDPNTNPYDIIEHSRAVIIISSTVGFEALLYYKPVIVVGNWTLRGLGVTIDIENLFDLRRAIKRALNNKVDKEKIKSVLFSLYNSMYKGDLLNPNPDWRLIADSTIKKFRKISISPVKNLQLEEKDKLGDNS